MRREVAIPRYGRRATLQTRPMPDDYRNECTRLTGHETRFGYLQSEHAAGIDGPIGTIAG